MARALLRIPLNLLVETIVCTLLNKFDCFVIIEGGTGIGKSTLAYHLARKTRMVFRKIKNFDEETIIKYYKIVGEPKGMPFELFMMEIQEIVENNGYKFMPQKDLIYSQSAMLSSLSSWYRIFIPDEMINITFNRDFYSEDQKNIIKMVNMYRDHKNLILACVPQFQTLDNQIKNLCKIRISVVRRGIGIVQTPNKTIYGRDKWDQQTNEKIEREWLQKGIKNPSYGRLTTVRGLTRFPPLTKKMEKIYQGIKDRKRTKILKKQMGIDEQNEKSTFEKTIDLILAEKIRNSNVIDGIALAEGRSPEGFKDSLSRELKKRGKDHRLAQYYWDKKAKKKGEGVF